MKCSVQRLEPGNGPSKVSVTFDFGNDKRITLQCDLMAMYVHTGSGYQGGHAEYGPSADECRYISKHATELMQQVEQDIRASANQPPITNGQVWESSDGMHSRFVLWLDSDKFALCSLECPPVACTDTDFKWCMTRAELAKRLEGWKLVGKVDVRVKT